MPGWDVPFSPEPDLEPAWSWMVWILEHLPKIPLLGAGVTMAWYIVEMRRMAVAGMDDKDAAFVEAEKDEMPVKRHYSVGAIGAVFRMWVWVDERALQIMRVLVVWCLVFFSGWLLC
jgi:hypothetical protein